MFSVITNIFNKKTKGPTLMESFTATGNLKKFVFWPLEMFDVYTTGDTAHIYTIFKFLPHTRQHGCIDILRCCNDSVNCLYHTRMVLSVGGSFAYFARNARCTVTTDLLVWYSNTFHFAILFWSEVSYGEFLEERYIRVTVLYVVECFVMWLYYCYVIFIITRMLCVLC
jgi:hypothetical protein